MNRIDNSNFGGFVVSRNVVAGVPVRYSYRERSEIAQLNGWTLYSEHDDHGYTNDPNNFEILSAETVERIVPVMLEVFPAPYGTELFWLYENGVHIGFYDLRQEREITVSEILGAGQE